MGAEPPSLGHASGQKTRATATKMAANLLVPPIDDGFWAAVDNLKICRHCASIFLKVATVSVVSPSKAPPAVAIPPPRRAISELELHVELHLTWWIGLPGLSKERGRDHSNVS